MPNLSVIMPAHVDSYEKLDWMQEALQSVQKQTFTDYEVIIVDDFSPVSLDALKNEFNTPQFRWFRTDKQSGPAMVRNTAVELSQNKQAILPLDSDDRLANSDVLSVMFTEWSNDKSKFYYGNLRRLKKQDNEFILDEETFNLAEYTFRDSLNKNGLMPVTSIFSYDAWKAGGGWTVGLDAGREDVEFWIKLGKVGFCGQKINHETLIYRQHETSRDYNLRRINRREHEMINKIRLSHQDVYEGRFPMGCCGGGKSFTPTVQNRTVSAPSTLDGYAENEKTWVEYVGGRSGNFAVNGQFTKYSYQIKGQGHKLQVHNQDLSRFRYAGRGQDFNINVAPPTDYQAPGEPQQYSYTPEPATLATIERLDEVAAG